MRIALIGDFNPVVIAHNAIPKALAMAGAASVWCHTTAVPDLSGFDGIWCVPASPYASMEGALGAIRFARESGTPFMGSCGGFQHAAVEYARNVRGIPEAAHAETDPEAAMPLIAPLECALVEKSGDIVIKEDSHLFRAYGTRQITEEYHCSFGLNPRFEELLMDGDLRVTARDLEGGVRAIELTSHPFFVATLFQSERRALRGELPPLAREFVRRCKPQVIP